LQLLRNGKRESNIFCTKEENIERRLQESLSKTPHERFIFLLKRAVESLFSELNHVHPNRSKNNFIVEKI